MMQRATVQVVGPGDRSSEGLQTPGMRREEAFADEASWVGLVRAEPGQVSGWHHHGDYETFFYWSPAGYASSTARLVGRPPRRAPATSPGSRRV